MRSYAECIACIVTALLFGPGSCCCSTRSVQLQWRHLKGGATWHAPPTMSPLHCDSVEVQSLPKMEISTTQEKHSLTILGKTNNWKRHYRLFSSFIKFFLSHYMQLGTNWLFSFHSFRATHFGQLWKPSASLCTSPSEWGRGDIKWGRGGDMATSPSW